MRIIVQKAVFVLGAAIGLLFLGAWACPGFAAELSPGGRDGARAPLLGARVCFPAEPDAVRLLEAAEVLPKVRVLADNCLAWRMAAEAEILARERQARAQAERIAQCEGERAEAARVARENIKAGEKAVKAVKVPWWRAAVSAWKWIAVGAVAGYTGGKILER